MVSNDSINRKTGHFSPQTHEIRWLFHPMAGGFQLSFGRLMWTKCPKNFNCHFINRVPLISLPTSSADGPVHGHPITKQQSPHKPGPKPLKLNIKQSLETITVRYKKSQDTKLIHRYLLHSYTLTTKDQKDKLRKQSHLPLQQKA